MAIPDDFNRSTFDNGNWEVVSGSMWVTQGSATARGVSLYADTTVRRAESSFPDDHYSQADCEWVDEVTGDSIGGVGARLDASGNGYWARVNAGAVELYKIVAGSATFIADYAAGIAEQTPTTIKLTCAGTTITVHVGGVLRITQTDTTHSSGKPGLIAYSNVLSKHPDFDNFECTDALSGGSGGGSGGAVTASTAITHRGPRTKFTRHRLGNVSSCVVNPAWVTIYAQSAGAPQIVARGQVEEGVTGLVKAPRSADIEVGDILEDFYDGRLFYVLQIHFPSNDVARRHCIVVEYFRPLADEFAYGVIDSYWSTTSAGWSVEASSGELTQTPPSGTLPSAGRLLYQLVAGDFDIWARLRCDAGSGSAIRRALVGARHPSSGLGVYVGDKDNGTNAIPIRLDEHAASTVAETTATGVASASYIYVRLRRIGAGFQTFYNNGGTDPAAEAGWTEIVASGSQFTSADPLRFGACGYTQTGAVGETRLKFLRNWSV